MLTPETPHLQESDDGQVNYIDPSHWQSILEDIREVREHFSPSKPTPSSDKPDDGSAGPETDPSLLFGSKSRVSMDDVLSSLPSQPICDMLLSRYFGARFMVLGESDSSRARPEYLHVLIRDAIKGIVHPHKFQNEVSIN